MSSRDLSILTANLAVLVARGEMSQSEADAIERDCHKAFELHCTFNAVRTGSAKWQYAKRKIDQHPVKIRHRYIENGEVLVVANDGLAYSVDEIECIGEREWHRLMDESLILAESVMV